MFKLTCHPIKKQAFGMTIGLSEIKKADFLKQSGPILGCISIIYSLTRFFLTWAITHIQF